MLNDDLAYTDHLGEEVLATSYLAIGAGDAPCSRYGTRSADHTPIILAVARILAENDGGLTPETLDHAASLVVNDSGDVAVLIVDHGTPEEIALLDADVAAEGRRMSNWDYDGEAS